MLDYILEYSDNTSYRKCMRTLMEMPNTDYVHTSKEEIDEETGDEQYYEEESMTKLLDEIYALTSQHHLFKELYEIAAGKMLSLNPEIGLAVLMSYDYLFLFYTCVLEYKSSPDSFNENTQSYVRIKEKIT